MAWITLTARHHPSRTIEEPPAVLVRSEHVSAVLRLANPTGAILVLTNGSQIDVNEDAVTVHALVLAAEP